MFNAPINGAAASGNFPQQDERLSATLPPDHALAIQRLLPRVQKQKCLHFIQHMISL
jgi:hypothetical protein